MASLASDADLPGEQARSLVTLPWEGFELIERARGQSVGHDDSLRWKARVGHGERVGQIAGGDDVAGEAVMARPRSAAPEPGRSLRFRIQPLAMLPDFRNSIIVTCRATRDRWGWCR